MRGRLPARSSADADYMVNKLLYYENPTSGDLDWMRKMCFIASDDASLTAEKTHRYVIQNYLAPNGIICDTIWDRTGGSTSAVFAAINVREPMRVSKTTGLEKYARSGIL